MKIYGDAVHSNKFYVLNDEKGLLWVPKLSLAKSYVSDPNCTSWFNKDIYCTSEDILIGFDGKYYIKSKLPVKPQEQRYEDNLSNFKHQANKYIKRKLQDYAEAKGFETFLELISYKSSSIQRLYEVAESGINYRDTIITYTDNFISNIDEITDETYEKYLSNFPVIE